MRTSIAGVGALAVAGDQPAPATRLFGAADAQSAIMGVSFQLPERALYDRATDAARMALGEAGFVAAWEAGRRLSLEEAVAEALALTDAIAAGVARGRVSR